VLIGKSVKLFLTVFGIEKNISGTKNESLKLLIQARIRKGIFASKSHEKLKYQT
jgi:hypothetical protein